MLYRAFLAFKLIVELFRPVEGFSVILFSVEVLLLLGDDNETR